MEEEMKESEQGKDLLHRRLKNWKIPVTAETIDSLVREFKTENAMELYHKIATEKIGLADIKRFLKESKG